MSDPLQDLYEAIRAAQCPMTDALGKALDSVAWLIDSYTRAREHEKELYAEIAKLTSKPSAELPHCAWIAYRTGREPIHFSKLDGWEITAVMTDRDSKPSDDAEDERVAFEEGYLAGRTATFWSGTPTEHYESAKAKWLKEQK